VLRYKETEDIDARFVEVERVVQLWRQRIAQVPGSIRGEFLSLLQISLIYHDAALEGDVLNRSEIKAAIDPTIISDTSLIPSYEEIKRFNEACGHAAELVVGRKKLKLDTIRDIYCLLSPDEKAKGAPYRKENPLHRLYYHDIAPPEKILPKMKKLGEWIEDPSTRQLHPIERVAMLHFRLMEIFPWAKETGRVARIVSNMLLAEAHYPLAVIHSIDRQRYYESLRGDHGQLMSIYLEACETTAKSELQVYEEAEKNPRARRRRA
jgi:Fic family protein